MVGLWGNGPLVQGPSDMYVLLCGKESMASLQISSTVSWHDGTSQPRPLSCNEGALTQGTRPC